MNVYISWRNIFIMWISQCCSIDPARIAHPPLPTDVGNGVGDVSRWHWGETILVVVLRGRSFAWNYIHVHPGRFDWPTIFYRHAVSMRADQIFETQSLRLATGCIRVRLFILRSLNDLAFSLDRIVANSTSKPHEISNSQKSSIAKFRRQIFFSNGRNMMISISRPIVIT